MSKTVGESLQLPRNLFIQMSGAPGSGKSTMAKLLHKSIGGLVINHDIIRSSLLEDNYGPFDQVATIAYNLQWALAEEVVKQGLNVIIDSTCNFKEVLDHGSALAKQYGFTYWYVECKVEDIDVLDERLRTREPMKSQRTGVDLPPAAAIGAREGEDSRALFRNWIENPCRPERNAIILDSTGSPEIDYIMTQIVPQPSAQASDRWVFPPPRYLATLANILAD